MLQADIERLALRGEPIPKDLQPYDTMLYYMLYGLYARYQAGYITKTDAQKQKQVILNTYQRVKDDYEQYTAICRMYQEKLRKGYEK